MSSAPWRTAVLTGVSTHTCRLDDTVFLAVLIVKALPQTPAPPLPRTPESRPECVCLVSEYAEHLINTLSPLKQSALLLLYLLVEHQDEVVCQKAAKSLPFPVVTNAG